MTGIPLSIDLSGPAGSTGLIPPNMYQAPSIFETVQREMNSQPVSSRFSGVSVVNPVPQMSSQNYPQMIPQMGQPTNLSQPTNLPIRTVQPVYQSNPLPIHSNHMVQTTQPYQSIQIPVLSQQAQLHQPIQMPVSTQQVQHIQTAPTEPSRTGVINEPILIQYKSGWLVTGNTIQYKDHLKNLGGKFGKNYKGPNGEDLIGWWFPADKYQQVSTLLGQIKAQAVQPTLASVYKPRDPVNKDPNMQKINIVIKRPKPSDLFFMVGNNIEKQLTLVSAVEQNNLVSQMTLREEGNPTDLYAVPVNINGNSVWIILSPQNTWTVLDIRSPPTNPIIFGGGNGGGNGGKIPSPNSVTNLGQPSGAGQEKYPQIGTPLIEGVTGPGVLDSITSFS